VDEFIRSIHKDKTAIYTDMVANGEVSLRPGIKELISDAKANGYRLAIATTTTPANVDALLSVTLGNEGRNIFEVICAGDSVANKKPAPDVYLQALQELDLPAENCIALEDSRNGLLSAHAAGIATVVTPGIYTSTQQFDEAALIIENLGASDFPEIYALLNT
jgi:HAD superfamily hydrolase (TIGR01509 family)